MKVNPYSSNFFTLFMGHKIGKWFLNAEDEMEKLYRHL